MAAAVQTAFCRPAAMFAYALLTIASPLPAQEDSTLIVPPSANTPLPPARETGSEPTATDGEPPADGERATAPRLAAAPRERVQPIEEVVVVDESEWRLPDLGSDWRQAEAAKPDDARIELSFLPLYDPENADPVQDLFERNSALHRMQLIEVIRVRFGGRPED